MIKSLFTITLLHTLLLASFSGKIVDKTTDKPINNAIINSIDTTTKSDENGSFSVQNSADTYHIKAYGYKPYTLDLNSSSTIELEPIHVKALYLTFWGANINSKTIKRILNIIKKSDLNAIVVDVKNEYGSTSYKTSVDKANSYGAYKKRTIKNIKEFIDLMRSNNIYTIARVVVFKDELQASNNEDYAIKNSDGTIWRNHDNMAWVDPFDTRSHSYTIAIAEDVAKVGFDEINFDYIRFPAKTGLVLAKENTQENRLKTIEKFLKSAQEKLKRYGTFISVDTYGNICWEKGDSGIGQKVESLAKYSDYLAPMLYPSGFAKGSFGYKHPADHPHTVIYRSIKNIKNRIEPIRVRPWLQYFKDYAHSKRYYKKSEIQAQIQASNDADTSGWMMWSPSSRYHLNYFKTN